MRFTRPAMTYVNPRVVAAQYAVRGIIPTRADELKRQLEAGGAAAAAIRFPSLIYCNIGNPQSLEQPPLTFFRQVMALVDAPMLLDNPRIVAELPKDVVERARFYLSKIGNATGAYTESAGYGWARKIVASALDARDGVAAGSPLAADFGDIFLTDGASTGVRLVMQSLIGGPSDAVMIPIPQYPLYTAQIALLGGTPVKYYLDESKGWSLNAEELTRLYDTSVANGTTPRLLVVINPGNPTGQVLDRATMENVIRFCHSKKLLLLADEVYQENIYDAGKQFLSFRGVALAMGGSIAKETEIVSLHSTSKGIIGECGRRGGFFHLQNIPDALKQQLIKMTSINLCSNVNGQIMTTLMMSPPKPGDVSFAQYDAEYRAIFDSLKRRAVLLANALNAIDGITCNPVEGAMYAFPTITLPPKYLAYNAAKNKEEGRELPADTRWCLELLEETGIVVVNGSGFEQAPGTLHFRTTILPPEAQMERMTRDIKRFMDATYAKYQ